MAPHQWRKEEPGQQGIVRNGYLPERNLLIGRDVIPVFAPRVRDKFCALSTELSAPSTWSNFKTDARTSVWI
ncbi:MAG TPA: hypothetical protein VLH40_06855 [Atribacteraceae bacterium]|nr:hypothetical protein [Atribacteraceae bacterium]